MSDHFEAVTMACPWADLTMRYSWKFQSRAPLLETGSPRTQSTHSPHLQEGAGGGHYGAHINR